MRKYLVLRSPSVLASEIREKTARTKAVYTPADEAPKAGNSFEESKGSSLMRQTEFSRWRRELAKGASDVLFSRSVAKREIPILQELPRPTLVSRQGTIPERESRTTLSKVDEIRRVAEAEAILSALQSSLWNRKRAAILLNVDYKALLYKMKKLGIGEKKAVSCG